MVLLISQITILVIGVTIILLAGRGMFAPEKLMTFVTSAIDKPWGIYIGVTVRLAMGAALIIAASASPFPVAFQVLGSLAIVAAVVLALMGRERVRSFLAWWSERFSASAIRLWLVFGIAFGAFLVYGVL